MKAVGEVEGGVGGEIIIVVLCREIRGVCCIVYLWGLKDGFCF